MDSIWKFDDLSSQTVKFLLKISYVNAIDNERYNILSDNHTMNCYETLVEHLAKLQTADTSLNTNILATISGQKKKKSWPDPL